MIPWKILDRAQRTDGRELTLSQRGHEFSIGVDGEVLMNSTSHGSEEELARQGCAAAAKMKGARVLVGGLGMGYTARAALDTLGSDARVDVVELSGAVVRWNREHLGHLAGAPLDDSRVRVIEADVADVIERSPAGYDVIVLDVDNGPEASTSPEDRRLYGLSGLQAALRALRGTGVFGLWSAFDAPPFSNRLRQAGFTVEVKHVRSHGRKGQRHTLWFARPFL